MRVRRRSREELDRVHSEVWVDPARRPHVEGSIAYIPVREGYRWDLEIPERSSYGGRGYQRLGDILVLHGPRPSKEEIEALVAWAHPRGMLWMRSLSGITRTPCTELLYGSSGDVLVEEAGCRYWLDPAIVMFAQGNRHERQRMGALVRKSGRPERVADCCAGIGYFTVPMARAGAFVHAIELAPRTFSFLQRTVQENCLEDRVQAECGDFRTHLSGTYDRLVIGHFDALSYLPCALAHAHPGSVLHVHTLDPNEEPLREAVETAGFSPTITMHRVKKYGPHRWHAVWDVVLT
jgi:tRNA wybutosine-synthesizing protein 2